MSRWTNAEDRQVADLGYDEEFTVQKIATRIGRSVSAVYQRHAKLKRLPCPMFVTANKSGELWFCEQGNAGHEGTCCGGKSLATYQAQGGTWP